MLNKNSSVAALPRRSATSPQVKFPCTAICSTVQSMKAVAVASSFRWRAFQILWLLIGRCPRLRISNLVVWLRTSTLMRRLSLIRKLLSSTNWKTSVEWRNVSRWSICSWRIWIAKHSVFSATSKSLPRLMPTSTTLHTPLQASKVHPLRSTAAHVRIARIAQQSLLRRRTHRWKRWASFVSTAARSRRISRTRCSAQISNS